MRCLIILLLFSCSPAYAGEVKTKIMYDFENSEISTVREKVTLSLNYSDDEYWVDETISHNNSQGANVENFFGGGRKYGVSSSLDLSYGILYQYDGNDSNYLASFRGRYKIGGFKFTGFYQPYLTRRGYIVKGDIASSGFVQGFEYRSMDKFITIRTGVEF